MDCFSILNKELDLFVGAGESKELFVFIWVPDVPLAGKKFDLICNDFWLIKVVLFCLKYFIMHVELAHNFIEHFQKIPKAFLTSLALYFLSHEFEINVFYVLFLSQSIKKLLCVFGLILALKLEIVDLTDDEDQLEIDLFVVEVSYLLHKGAKGWILIEEFISLGVRRFIPKVIFWQNIREFLFL